MMKVTASRRRVNGLAHLWIKVNHVSTQRNCLRTSFWYSNCSLFLKYSLIKPGFNCVDSDYNRSNSDQSILCSKLTEDIGIIEPRHEISNYVVCATSISSDQPVQKRSLTRAFASRLNIL